MCDSRWITLPIQTPTPTPTPHQMAKQATAPRTPAHTFQRAFQLLQQGQGAQAEQLLRDLTARFPLHFDGLHLLGLCHLQRQDWSVGCALLQRAIAVNDGVAGLHNNCGIALRELRQFDAALRHYDRALQLQPDHADAHNNRGNVLRDMHRYGEAVSCYDHALALKPANPQALHNRGLVLRELGRYLDALASHDRALALKPDYVEAWKARGRVLEQLQRWDDACASYQRALALVPDDLESLSDLASVLDDLHRFDDALACCDRAVAIDPRAVAVLANRASVLSQLKRHDDAALGYARVLELQPNHPYALGNRLFSQLNACDWTDLAARIQQLHDAIDRGERAALPFSTVAWCADAARQRACAQIFAADQHPPQLLPGDVVQAQAQPQPPNSDYRRLRIAYVSADLHDHATAHLMVDLFESHDRAQFEVWAISIGPDRPSPMRDRLQRAFEHVIDARTMNDAQVAQRLRDEHIDIAIDLKGYTRDSRPGIFAHRAAPLQVSYLGYPGTMGHACIDYLIADATVVPESHAAFYSEQIVRLSGSYQVNSRSRVVADATPSRADCGLPATGFVWCCFNNNYKITPEVFAVWMRLLCAVDGSVLWLLEDNPVASANLRRAAVAHGVAPECLVFAPRLPLPDHLARYRLADLFLDTAPCNAHTTASDALWAGLPVLTCAGETFASRVAASLLHAVGLPELVTDSVTAYQAKALALARDSSQLADIRTRLAAHRDVHPLFDTDRTRLCLEAAYRTMLESGAEGPAATAH
jgi:predicted O-linked N-acetylglucosamine transferase (SPINDLY family)